MLIHFSETHDENIRIRQKMRRHIQTMKQYPRWIEDVNEGTVIFAKGFFKLNERTTLTSFTTQHGRYTVESYRDMMRLTFVHKNVLETKNKKDSVNGLEPTVDNLIKLWNK